MKYKRMGRCTSETEGNIEDIEPPAESPVPEVTEEATTAIDAVKGVSPDGQ